MPLTPTRSVAHANIALAKYWGKASVAENLPAVPSLSMTLDGLRTFTEVEPAADLAEDLVTLDGEVLSGRPLARAVALLDRVRRLAGVEIPARITTRNDFPTASGLASSASGFAALALCAARAYGLDLSLPEVSELARAASASAARSLFGGFVALGAGARAAERIAPQGHWPLVMLVALTSRDRKAIGSSEAMLHTAATSPYYASFVAHAPAIFEQIRAAIMTRDLERLGEATERSALMMHASMMVSSPPVLYWSPATVALIERVRSLRRGGTPAYFTIDAGPHVKLLTEPGCAAAVAQELAHVPGVERVIHCGVGPDATVVESSAATSGDPGA